MYVCTHMVCCHTLSLVVWVAHMTSLSLSLSLTLSLSLYLSLSLSLSLSPQAFWLWGVVYQARHRGAEINQIDKDSPTDGVGVCVCVGGWVGGLVR